MFRMRVQNILVIYLYFIDLGVCLPMHPFACDDINSEDEKQESQEFDKEMEEYLVGIKHRYKKRLTQFTSDPKAYGVLLEDLEYMALEQTIYERKIRKLMKIEAKFNILRKEYRLLHAQSNMRPVLKRLEYLVLPSWLYSSSLFSRKTKWMLVLTFQLTWEAKYLRDQLSKNAISVERFIDTFVSIYKKPFELVAHVTRPDFPNIDEKSWNTLFEKLGFEEDEHGKQERSIFRLSLQVQQQLEKLEIPEEYTTTTLKTPRGKTFMVYINGVNLGGNTEKAKEESLKEMCGIYSKTIGETYFPMKPEYSHGYKMESFFIVKELEEQQLKEMMKIITANPKYPEKGSSWRYFECQQKWM